MWADTERKDKNTELRKQFGLGLMSVSGYISESVNV